MRSGRNPDHMTADERRREIVGILAAGVLRAVRQSRRRGDADSDDLPDSRDIRLELGRPQVGTSAPVRGAPR